jgi:uncharacterized Zn-binding protein involved in type VI secretion
MQALPGALGSEARTVNHRQGTAIAARHHMSRTLRLLVLLLAFTGRPAPVFEEQGCPLPVPAEQAWLMALPVTPTLAAGKEARPRPADGKITLEDLDGEWDGTAIMSGASSPFKQVEAAMAPYLGVTHEMQADASPSPGGVTFDFRGASGSLWSCPFAFNAGALSCTTSINGYRMVMTGSVARVGDALRITGAWTAAQTNISIRGSWGMSMAVSDVTVELLHPAGRSPKVFASGWSFGARCIKGPGTPAEKDLSGEVQWSGSGTFSPERGALSRPRFATIGQNKITLVCAGQRRSFPVQTVGTAGFARMTDESRSGADTHNCPACPHPTRGRIATGSPNVSIDDLPAARVGDFGLHTACCGPNNFRIRTGSAEVLIDGRPAARIGSETEECGGRGAIVQGALGGSEPDAPTQAAGGFFGMPAAPGQGTTRAPASTGSARVPAPSATAPGVALPKVAIVDWQGAQEASLSTTRGETKVARNTPEGAKVPSASVALLPYSQVTRGRDGRLRLDRGAVLVTTLPPAKQIVLTKDGQIELGSQARIAQLPDGTDIAMLSGAALVRNTTGAETRLSAGEGLRFGASMGKATKLAPMDMARSVAGYVDPSSVPESAAPEAPGMGLFGWTSRLWSFFPMMGAFVVTLLVTSVMWVLRRRRKPAPGPRAYASRPPSAPPWRGPPQGPRR